MILSISTLNHYAECRVLFAVMLSVIMLSVIMLSVIYAERHYAKCQGAHIRLRH